MPAQRPRAPLTRPRVIAPVTGDSPEAFVQRMLSDASQRAADQLRDRSGVSVSLIVGANYINHGLSRRPLMAAITPTVANASWAWALTSADERQAVITCVGIAQPNAYVEFS